MNTRDQFGQYLLLKKLAEDALGETFRAGRIGRQTLDRIVLLRVYNGQGLDSERVARTIQSRGALAQGLKSPNITNAVDSGQVRGVPYVAYDYFSGRTLAQLAEQAVKRGQPVPLDHALLIAERIAAGLAVAFETRFGDERVTHGMLTPHQVLVSHEGELRLCGFEAAPGLRASAAHPVIKQSLGRYLAPEALAGEPPGKNDDVYSVGAILFELLTAQPAPALPAAGLGPLLEQAVVAADGGNLHPDLAGLLKRSLAPHDQRVGDIVAWHKSLAKLMADGQYNPTTFNLAFFLHNLFRDEIERETQELETERTQAIQIPAQPAAAPAAPAPAISPSVCIMRVKPVGAMPNGRALGPPSTSRVVSTTGTLRRIDGWNSTSWNAWRARTSESSPSAAPSV
jgi:serine/threonine-protein kinase